MMTFTTLLQLIIATMFLQNMLVYFFFGVESLEQVRQSPKEVLRFTVSLLIILPLVSVLSFFIYQNILIEFDDLGVIVYDYTYVKTLLLIGLMVLVVSATRLLLSVLFPKVLRYVDQYVKHLSMHTLILGSLLVMLTSVQTITESVVFALSASVGYGLVLLGVAAIEKQLQDAPIPKGFKGLPLQLIILALIALIFSAFSV
jgi:Na+-translocating ferredoxin:NAD+ oxidoreductase subunit A